MKDQEVYEIARRELLQIGAIGLLGLTLPVVKRLRTVAASSGTRKRSARSPRKVVYIFLTGGCSQHETFDMKPDAASNVRGEFKPIKTRTPGLQVCEHLPRLAKLSDKFAILRSMTHFSNKHIEGSYIMVTGDTILPDGINSKHPDSRDAPGIAAIAGRFRRGTGPLPGSVVLPHFLLRDTGRFIPGQYGGWMGQKFDPWLVHAAARCHGMGPCPECFTYDRTDTEGVRWVHTAYPFFDPPRLGLPDGVPQDRFQKRLSLLNGLDGGHTALERMGAKADEYQQQAVSLLTSAETRNAFELRGVDDKVLEAYGRNMFGFSLLLTRRLLEAGVNMIQVNLGRNGTWDHHSSIFPVLKDHLLPQTDRALSTFLGELDERGLLDETLIVMAGEFGRTPQVFRTAPDKRPGRGHWGPVQSVFFAGGGVQGGQIIGASDSLGGEPKENAKRPQDLAATIYEALGIPREAEYVDLSGRPRPVYLGTPLGELYS